MSNDFYNSAAKETNTTSPVAISATKYDSRGEIVGLETQVNRKTSLATVGGTTRLEFTEETQHLVPIIREAVAEGLNNGTLDPAVHFNIHAHNMGQQLLTDFYAKKAASQAGQGIGNFFAAPAGFAVQVQPETALSQGYLQPSQGSDMTYRELPKPQRPAFGGISRRVAPPKVELPAPMYVRFVVDDQQMDIATHWQLGIGSSPEAYYMMVLIVSEAEYPFPEENINFLESIQGEFQVYMSENLETLETDVSLTCTNATLVYRFNGNVHICVPIAD